MKLLKDYLFHLKNNPASIGAMVMGVVMGTASVMIDGPVFFSIFCYSITGVTIFLDLYTMPQS